MNGIATTSASWGGQIRLANPPRGVITNLNRGATLGSPHDTAQQKRILAATLGLLAQDAPLPIVRLNEAPT
ncbi:MAG: hypothetical protein H6658_00760 [Ardenticatenaceae bacterium]|nr:hypothetical protein [Ardenticatenaceae bacterium]